ncbi:hypothetical protein [Francisella philomiragia]|uniref:Uncharacterized protein n=1 Tax=Francisella philomiragia TaxID=28110 RepID=A0A0B6D4M5_9GAMM|nr:hypothetical protein [Francisella philomiragia]AJI53257.1 hypothetical protein LA55_915 [Francisella philomiragia]
MLSNNSQDIDKQVKGNKLKGNLSLGFDLNLKRSNKDDNIATSAVVASVVAGCMLAGAVLLAPEITIPAIAVGGASQL